MDKIQFNEVKNILKKYLPKDYLFRGAMNIFLISHEIRPGFFYDTIDECLQDDNCSNNLNDYFEEEDLPLKASRFALYNTNLLNSKTVQMQKSDKDGTRYFGRILGYPEIWDDKDVEKNCKTIFCYVINIIIKSEVIFGWNQKEQITIKPEMVIKILKALKILGINKFNVGIEARQYDKNFNYDPTEIGNIEYNAKKLLYTK